MKIRCSALGKIMTESRSKSEVLSQTAKTYIQELVLEDVYGIKKEFSSRYTDKGNIQEDESIELAARVLDLPFCTKNDEYFENEFIKGTPDLILEDEIIDIKCSWDGTTFPWFEDELPKAVIDGLTHRVGRYPTKRDGGATWHGIILDDSGECLEVKSRNIEFTELKDFPWGQHHS